MRDDIQYLRAIAIIAVLLFHFDIASFTGGFLGVDSFFVISGFLISQNITKSIRQGTFNYYEFLRRRVVRLFPALYFTIAITIPASFLLLPPYATETFTGSVVSSGLALSNIFFFRTLNYFSIDGEIQPLLHTWSLGVEEQFYLLWPLVLLLIIRRFPRYFHIALLVLLIALSLSLAQHWITRNPAAAFYLLPFRAFEFAMGALIALSSAPKLTNSLRSIVYGTSLIMLGAAFVLLSDPNSMPGLASLWPLTATAVALWAGLPKSATIRPMKWIGDASYSIYLIHWPIAVFSGLLIVEVSPLRSTAGIIASIVAGYFMYIFIENPVRYKVGLGRWINQHIFRMIAVVLVLFAIADITSIKTHGWRDRFSDDNASSPSFIEYNAKEQYSKGTCFLEESYSNLDTFRINGCISSIDTDRDALLIGDSLAAQYSAALRGIAKSRGYTFSQITAASCSFVQHTHEERDPACALLVDQIIVYLENSDKYEVIIVGGSYYDHKSIRRRFAKTLKKITKQERTVGVLGPPPRLDEPLGILLQKYTDQEGNISDDIHTHVDAPTILRHDSQMEDALSGLGTKYVSTAGAFCSRRFMKCKTTMNGVPIYRDQIHLTKSAAEYFGVQLLSGLFKAL